MRKKFAVFTTGYAANILTQFMYGLRKGFEPYQVDTHLFIAFPTYSDTPEYASGELNIFKLPDMSKYDGAVLFANALDQPGVAAGLVARCREAGIPVVSHGKVLEGAHNIVSDNHLAMCDLTEHIISEHSVKSVCFLSGTRDNYDAMMRLSSVKEVLAKHSIPFPDENIFYTDWNGHTANLFVNDLIDKNKVPDAFICANDDIAITVCITLKERGFKVPEDVIVTGFDHIPESETFYPSIATVDQQFMEHGEYAAQMIYDLSEGKERETEVSLQCRFFKGESCGCSEDEHNIALRRDFCTDSYIKHNREVNLGLYTLRLERTILASNSYAEMKENLAAFLKNDYRFESDTFHLFMDAKAFLSASDNQADLTTVGYSECMDNVFSIHDGQISAEGTFRTKDLLPETDNSENHLYVFTPLHDNQYSTGYMIFRDCYESMKNRVIHNYQQRIDIAIEKFRQHLQLKYLNERVIEFSRIDPLTHVKNRFAYESRVEEIVTRMHGDPDFHFAIVMFDVNNLKAINDELGHDAGDDYLIRSSRLLCSFFKRSPVYRIGGDEFIAILEDEDYEKRHDLIKSFRDKTAAIWDAESQPENRISIASGMSSYDSRKHSSYDDVAKEADQEMYENKKEMKKRYHLGSVR